MPAIKKRRSIFSSLLFLLTLFCVDHTLEANAKKEVDLEGREKFIKNIERFRTEIKKSDTIWFNIKYWFCWLAMPVLMGVQFVGIIVLLVHYGLKIELSITKPVSILMGICFILSMLVGAPLNVTYKNLDDFAIVRAIGLEELESFKSHVLSGEYKYSYKEAAYSIHDRLLGRSNKDIGKHKYKWAVVAHLEIEW